MRKKIFSLSKLNRFTKGVKNFKRWKSASLSDSQIMTKQEHSGRWVTVRPCWSKENGNGKMTWRLCGKYFIAIVSHPKCFLPHHWNTDSKQMARSSVKDIQAKKTSTRAYSQSSLLYLTGKLYEIWNIPKQFSWTKQTFMKGILCASKWMRKGVCFLRAWV